MVVDLDVEDLAADLGPGQAGGDPDLVLAALLLGQEAGRAEEAVDGRFADQRPASFFPSAKRRATLRQMLPISRSRLRSPASAV